MAESGIFRGAALQPCQRETLLAAPCSCASSTATLLPTPGPVDDGLLEVMDPARRTVRLQKEQAAAARAVAADRRKANFGSPGGVERRKAHRRSGERRARR